MQSQGMHTAEYKCLDRTLHNCMFVASGMQGVSFGDNTYFNHDYYKYHKEVNEI